MASEKLSIEDVDVAEKRVVIRVDFNVPTKKGKVGAVHRIKAALATINYVLGKQANSVVLLTHLGRPQGTVDPQYSLAPVAAELETLLKKKIIFLKDCVGEEVLEICKKPPPGSIILLENLRFHIEEEGRGKDSSGAIVRASPDEIREFRANLAKLGDIYVNDAFGTAHRSHSSMLGHGYQIRAGGLLLMNELKFFASALDGAQHPYLAILGGTKVAEKIVLVQKLLENVDSMIIGGGMSFTFLKTMQNTKVGSSLIDEDGALLIPNLIDLANKNNVTIHFPVDFICSEQLENSDSTVYTIEQGIPDGKLGLDIGPKSRLHFQDIILSSRLCVWNGPQGVYELAKFSDGTRAVLDAVIEATTNGTVTIIGGGNTTAFCTKWNAEGKVSHISTGGAASLEMLEGKILPAVAALCNAPSA